METSPAELETALVSIQVLHLSRSTALWNHEAKNETLNLRSRAAKPQQALCQASVATQHLLARLWSKFGHMSVATQSYEETLTEPCTDKTEIII